MAHSPYPPYPPRSTNTSLPLELDRHELFAGPSYRFDLKRRDFLRLLGSGVAVALVAPGCAALDGATAGEAADGARAGPFDDEQVGAWLHLGEDGRVRVFTGKVEVGQDIRTSLTQAVADELRVSPEAVTLTMGDTDLTPFDQGTFGSRTTPQMATQLRRAAATLRRSLTERAARTWGVEAGALEVEGGRVRHAPSGRSAALGELAGQEALTLRVAADAPVTPAERWTVAGRDLAKVNGPDIVTGRHRYTSDLRFPAMLYGRVLRPPAIGAALRALDSARAEALPGVVAVRDGDFAGVAAPDSHTAARALALLEAEWSDPPPAPSDRDIFRYLTEHSAPGGGRGGGGGGSGGGGGGGASTRALEAALAAAPVRLDAAYALHYVAHVPMEPRAALAHWEGERLTVWTGTQRPFGVRDELARAFRVGSDRVRVIMPDTGGAFGGKHTGEAAVEAARLARAAGAPVKLVWTREEEFRWAYFRPAGVMEVRAGADADGRLTAWDFHNHNSGNAGLATPYRIASQQRVQYHAVDSPLRQGSYRALASVANHFAREGVMNELAHAAGIDPLDFRRRNLPAGRLRDVLEAAAERMGWGAAPPPGGGRGRGVACGTEKGGYLATCVEASVELGTGAVRVERVVSAFECGAIVNPDHLRSQVEGCVLMGLGGALFEKIRFEGGRILNAHLADYRVPRFSDLPELETVLLDRRDLASAGAGEAPIIGVAPALAEALFQATGRRLRELPLAPDGVVA